MSQETAGSQYEEELIIEQIEIGPMQNFTYLVGSRSTREVVIVDPAWDIDGLVKHINERDYVLKGALVTHYHPDHCGGSFGKGGGAGPTTSARRSCGPRPAGPPSPSASTGTGRPGTRTPPPTGTSTLTSGATRQ